MILAVLGAHACDATAQMCRAVCVCQ